MTVDVYIKGSLCVSGNSSPFILEPTGSQGTVSVYVGGKFKSKSNASPIGTSTAKLKSVTVVGRLHRLEPQLVGRMQQAGESFEQHQERVVWLRRLGEYLLVDPARHRQADRDGDTWYSAAAPGPATGCGAGSTYPSTWTQTSAYFTQHFFDNDTTRNSSVGTVHMLELVDRSSGAGGTAHNSFDCRWYDSDGTLVGQLKWTYPSSCGAAPASGTADLTVNGTVFIDGNLSFASCDYAVYQGRGTIYVNGTVTFANGAKVCALPISGNPCLGNFDPSQNLLEIVAVNAGNANPGFALSGAATYEGISYTNGVFNGGNGASVNGPVIADTATMSGNAKLRSTVDPPPGAPGAASTTTTTTQGPDQASWSGVPGSWQQLK